MLGSTSTSPGWTPLVISVWVSPTSPIVTGTTVSVPLRWTVTVCRSPSEVIARFGTATTSVAEPAVIERLAVEPTPTPGGAESRDTWIG